MGWYDVFATFYDASLERLYDEQRKLATEALQLRDGVRVLDVPCGTGLSFPYLVDAAGQHGRVLGVDGSRGMLNKARRRIERAGFSGVSVCQADVHAIDAEMLEDHFGTPTFDRLHMFLGLTAFERWREAFDRLFDLLEPGGRCVIVDVHAPKPGFQGKMVNLVARADITRAVWEPLLSATQDFERRPLPTLPQHGGDLFLATATKP